MRNIQYQKGAIDAGSCISGGWDLIKSNYWIFFGMTTLLIVGSIIISCIPLVGGVLFQILLAPPLTVGIYYTLFRQMERQPTDFGMMFKGFDKFGAAVVVGLIRSIPTIIWTIISFALNLGNVFLQPVLDAIKSQTGGGYGTDFAAQNDTAPLLAGGMIAVLLVVGFIFLLFSIAWGITFFFSLTLVADHDISPMDAIKLSASAGWSNVGGIILLAILEGLILIVGVLAICVGMLFVMPIVFAATACAYRQVFPWIERNFNMAPPPPTAYGFGGQQG